MKNRRAQTTLEVTILLMITVAAFLAMYAYLRMSIQGGWKTNTDTFSDRQFSGDIEKVGDGSIYDSGVFYGSTRIGLDLNNDYNPDANISNLDKAASSFEKGRITVSGWGVNP